MSNPTTLQGREFALCGEHTTTHASLTAPDSVLGGPLCANLKIHCDASEDIIAWRSIAMALRVSGTLSAADGGPTTAVLVSQLAPLPTEVDERTIVFDLIFEEDRIVASMEALSATTSDVALELHVDISAPPKRFGVRRPLPLGSGFGDAAALPALFMLNQAAEASGRWSLQRSVLLLRPLRFARLAERVVAIASAAEPRGFVNVSLSNHHNKVPIVLTALRLCAATGTAAAGYSAGGGGLGANAHTAHTPAQASYMEATTTAGGATPSVALSSGLVRITPAASTAEPNLPSAPLTTPQVRAPNGSAKGVIGAAVAPTSIVQSAAPATILAGTPGPSAIDMTAAASPSGESGDLEPPPPPPPRLLTDGRLPQQLPPSASYAVGIEAPPGMALLLSVEWHAEASSHADIAPTALHAPSVSRSSARTHFPLRAPTSGAAAASGATARGATVVAAAPFSASLSIPPSTSGLAQQPRLGVPFSATCRVVNHTALAFEWLELVPSDATASSANSGSEQDRHGSDAARSALGGTAAAATRGAARSIGESAPSLVCLMERVSLGRLQPGESAYVALELVAVVPGCLREELRLRVHDTHGGGTFEAAADIEVHCI